MALQSFSSGQTLTAQQMSDLQKNDYNQTVSAKTTSYTLVAGDVGTHVQMTASTATTISVPAATFAAGDSLFISSLGAGACTIQAASTAITVTGTNLVLAQYGGGTLRFQSASAATFFSGGAPAYGKATGGIGSPTAVTIGDVNYEYLQFNSTGTLTVTKAGFFDFLAIGGGGGSSYVTTAFAGGGGGAGQVVSGSIYLTANQTITIGGGSSFYVYTLELVQANNTIVGAASPFNVGAIGNIVANDLNGKGLLHVGGGIGCFASQTGATGNEDALIGFRGGDSSAQQNGGGGGGQSGRGGNGSSTTGGTGGPGYDISAFIGGGATFRAQGGGGGGSVTGGAAATGGVAGSANTTPPNGGANTGQGGGGGFGIQTTGNGGSGVCYIRYKV